MKSNTAFGKGGFASPSKVAELCRKLVAPLIIAGVATARKGSSRAFHSATNACASALAGPTGKAASMRAPNSAQRRE